MLRNMLFVCRMRSSPPRRGRSSSPSRIRHRSSLSRSKSRSRSRSPRSPPRYGGRYKCDAPKYPPYARIRTIPDVSKRYDDSYIPPEFCSVQAGWPVSAPDHKPLSLVQPLDFQVQKVRSCRLPQITARRTVQSSMTTHVFQSFQGVYSAVQNLLPHSVLPGSS